MYSVLVSKLTSLVYRAMKQCVPRHEADEVYIMARALGLNRVAALMRSWNGSILCIDTETAIKLLKELAEQLASLLDSV